MRLLGDRPTEIWEEPVEGPIGDIEAAHLIRDICRAAADTAEKLASSARKPGARKQRADLDRYQRAARAAMEIAMKINDDLLRDSAVRQILVLCLRANDLRTAQTLFAAIGAVSIREDVMQEYPLLRQ